MAKLKKRDAKEVEVIDKELAEIDRNLSAIYGVKHAEYKDL
ncbi:MAG: hypothetical protein AABX90_02800 [Nanoarchaeota archaeon]